VIIAIIDLDLQIFLQSPMKFIFSLAVFIYNSIQISAQIIDSFNVDSKILNKQIKCFVYTPKNCNQTYRNALYLLHGAFGNTNNG
jgi:beta-N-acetylglucosaminidase